MTSRRFDDAAQAIAKLQKRVANLELRRISKYAPGMVMEFAGTTAPDGWLFCDGSAVSRSSFSDLFDAIGTVWGAGDGSTTFNIPDTRNRFLIGVGTNVALAGTGGSWNHTHSGPSHTHTGPSHTHTNPNVNSGGSHVHSQGNTGSGGGHSHALGSAGYAMAIVVNQDVYVRRISTASNNYNLKTTNAGPQLTVSENWSFGAQLGGSTNSVGNHAHTTPNTNSGGSHAHSQGSTGAAGTGSTGAAGTGSTGSNNPPFAGINYIIYAGA